MPAEHACVVPPKSGTQCQPRSGEQVSLSVRRQTLPRPLERKETDPPSGRPHCRGLTWIANAHSHAVPSNLPLTGERGCRLQARPNSRASGEGFETRAVGAPENDGYPPRFSRFSRFSRRAQRHGLWPPGSRAAAASSNLPGGRALVARCASRLPRPPAHSPSRSCKSTCTFMMASSGSPLFVLKVR